MQKRIPLSEAALRLGLSYHQVRERLFRGALLGGRDRYGHFYVEDGPGLMAPLDGDQEMAPVAEAAEGDED